MSPAPSCHGDCAARVLDAALEVFCESGYRSSIDAVAARAQVARQTIYNHFGNKEALFCVALTRAVKEVFTALATDDGDYRARLFNFGMRFRQRVLAPDAINMHKLLISEASRFPELAKSLYESCFVYSRRQMAAVLQSAMDKGVLRREDPMEAAHILMDMLVSHDHTLLVFGCTELDPAEEERKVNRSLELFLRIYAPAAA
ncbi:TetR/AcrR family transcriptional regulator C-terminal domain-containing protein [Chitiniphilus shinanonensis]|uniref:TetR/AcrR family transcriptional regulator C-terminal domain-containing protein n=1 Tax=Chitiniphilus shinanonensis TaxID=553088 RepID=UPI000A03B6F5|nr:TetR/AcrR family transcriptional regulator C-terminal domain-containing protein [Chitiniphilus shinanonensis]